MWEMGVLLFEMVFRESPFRASNPQTASRRILTVDLQFRKGADPDVKNLIENLCRLHPQDRLTAAEAKTHPFILRNCATIVVRSEQVENDLEEEVRQALQAKSLMEQDLMSTGLELTELQRKLKHERRM